MRLFVALDLPDLLRGRLAALSHHAIPGARWVPADNYHVTLRFIGEAAAWQAEEIDHALAALRAPGFALTLAGIGSFGAKGGRGATLYAGVERSAPLDHLRAKVETALQRIGLEPERRRFWPHVTLARLDNAPEAKLAEWVQAHSLFRCPPVRIAHFTLFSSLLNKDHPVYTPEVEYALGAA
ncbi:MAG TPA: RNA 2',3'-cyclic phosphodiesterase [Acetobacteraceae bacterium]|nr:RNA 2',3'-cyclic phosphodiesterase [Acetobacteraceae bacterium]